MTLKGHCVLCFKTRAPYGVVISFIFSFTKFRELTLDLMMQASCHWSDFPRFFLRNLKKTSNPTSASELLRTGRMQLR